MTSVRDYSSVSMRDDLFSTAHCQTNWTPAVVDGLGITLSDDARHACSALLDLFLSLSSAQTEHTAPLQMDGNSGEVQSLPQSMLHGTQRKDPISRPRRSAGSYATSTLVSSSTQVAVPLLPTLDATLSEPMIDDAEDDDEDQDGSGEGVDDTADDDDAGAVLRPEEAIERDSDSTLAGNIVRLAARDLMMQAVPGDASLIEAVLDIVEAPASYDAASQHSYLHRRLTPIQSAIIDLLAAVLLPKKTHLTVGYGIRHPLVAFLALSMISARPVRRASRFITSGYSNTVVGDPQYLQDSAVLAHPRGLSSLIAATRYITRLLAYHAGVKRADVDNLQSVHDGIMLEAKYFITIGRPTIFDHLSSLAGLVLQSVMASTPVPRLLWIDMPHQFTWSGSHYSWTTTAATLTGTIRNDMLQLLEEACLGLELSEIFNLLPPLSSIHDTPVHSHRGANFLSNDANLGIKELQSLLIRKIFGDQRLIDRFLLPSYRASDLSVSTIAAATALHSVWKLEALLRYYRHFAHGPPQRGGEIASETIRNPNAAVLRTILIWNGKISSTTGYSKCLSATGLVRYNVHFSDDCASHIIYAIIVLVRPLMK
ncbi:hypothetical protein EMMF5_006483 [Cystobasidiomycetes sp. EMM_F5]